MAVGGYAEEKCGPGNPGCNYNKAMRKNKRMQNMRKLKNAAGKVLSGIAGTAAATAAGLGVKKILEQKKGGTVSRKKK